MTDAEMQAQASQKLSLALPEERPGGIRKVEFVWLSLFAVLLGWHLLDKDVEIDRKVVEEREKQVAKCQAVQDQHARNLATLLDRGGVLFVGGEAVTTCRRKG